MRAIHAAASGMNGMRTAGDLVARAQFAKNLKIDDAKKYVSKKLGVDAFDLSDEHAMKDVREEFGFGALGEFAETPRGIAAKLNIEKALDLKINSCEMHRNLCK
jgi:dimethylamine--corrinoid protein Co-methyltransferase